MTEPSELPAPAPEPESSTGHYDPTGLSALIFVYLVDFAMSIDPLCSRTEAAGLVAHVISEIAAPGSVIGASLIFHLKDAVETQIRHG